VVPGKGGIVSSRTVYLVADVLKRSQEPISIRQIANEIDRPLRSVSNVILRLRMAELVEAAKVIKPLGSRRFALYRWCGKMDTKELDVRVIDRAN